MEVDLKVDLKGSFHNTEKKGKIADDVAAAVDAAVAAAVVVAAVVFVDNKTAADEYVADNQDCVSVRCPVFDRQLKKFQNIRCWIESSQDSLWLLFLVFVLNFFV